LLVFRHPTTVAIALGGYPKSSRGEGKKIRKIPGLFNATALALTLSQWERELIG
jgi:hypothetical protein